MQIPLSYFDQTAIEEVPLDLWHEVFDVAGWPSSVADNRDAFTHADVTEAIRRDELSDDLLYALEALHTLGTEAGREAIVAVMQDRRVEVQALPKGASERELAMWLYIGQRKDASLADVFARAHIQVQESGDHRRYNEFLGVKARSVTNAHEKRELLRAAVLCHCQKADLGDHVQVDILEDDDIYVFRVLRTDRMKKPLAVLPGQVARTLIPHRQVHGDLLRYEAGLGRLRIAARASSMVEFYRTTLGTVLFDDADFFTGDPVCSLSVLQERGRSALTNHGVFGVSRVRMTECTWECGDQGLMILRGAECFNLIEQHHLSLTEGMLIQAKLKVDVIGRSARPVTVNIRVPSRIEVSQRAQEPLMDELLDAIGIRTVPPAAQKVDLWSLYPWRHPLPIWRGLFGNITDVLVKQGALLRTQLDAVPHPDYPASGNVLRVQAIGKGEFQGVSDLPEIPSRSLSATDVEALELMPERFRLHLQTILGIKNGGVAWSDGDEILELGWLPVADERLYVVYALREPTSNVADRVRARAAEGHVVLLIPANRPVQGQGAVVVLDSAEPQQQQVIREGISACGIDENMPAIHRAPSTAELIVDKRLKKVWAHGIEIQSLPPDSQAFLFIEILASSNGVPVPAEAITRALSGARLNTDGTTTARQAKGKAKKAIEAALATKGAADFDDPFPSHGTGCYRCTLRSFVD